MANAASRRSPRPLAVIVRTAAGLLAVGLAVVVFRVLVLTRPEPTLRPVQEQRLTVNVVRAERVPLARTWTAYGSARAKRSSDLRAEVAGEVIERPERIDPGVAVEAGELIVAIDPEEFEARLERARSAIAALQAELEGLDVEQVSLEQTVELAAEASRLARWERDRVRAAQEREAATEAELVRLEAALTRVAREETDLRQRLALLAPRRQALQAQIMIERSNERLAQLDLRRARIAAPFAGELQVVEAQEGERLAVGEIVARLVDSSVIEIPVEAPLSALGQVRVGDRVGLAAEGPLDAAWQGVVARIAPEASTQSRTFTLFVETAGVLPDGRPAPSPGHFLRASIVSEAPEMRFVLPRAAVAEERVYVVDAASRVRLRTVVVERYVEARFPSIDPRETQWAVVSEGLEEGDLVVVSNLDEIEPGLLVDPADVARESTAAVGAAGPIGGLGAGGVAGSGAR